MLFETSIMKFHANRFPFFEHDEILSILYEVWLVRKRATEWESFMLTTILNEALKLFENGHEVILKMLANALV